MQEGARRGRQARARCGINLRVLHGVPQREVAFTMKNISAAKNGADAYSTYAGWRDRRLADGTRTGLRSRATWCRQQRRNVTHHAARLASRSGLLPRTTAFRLPRASMYSHIAAPEGQRGGGGA